MPNLMTVLKAEIARVARKETKAACEPLLKQSSVTRSAMADLKRRIDVLEKASKHLNVTLAKPDPQPEPASAAAKNWISGKGVKGLRQKLGLTQAEFAKLTGVTTNAVYLWESKPGMLRLRDATKAGVMAVRGLSAKEAEAKLAEMGATKKSDGKGARKPLKTKST